MGSSGSEKPLSARTIRGVIQSTLALPVHFVHRIRTGGVRFLIQLILANVVFVVIFRVITADEGQRYQAVFPWTVKEDLEPGMDGSLRIVAFGSQDVFGSAPRSTANSDTWLQALCTELNCSSLHSFVPHHDSEKVMAFPELYQSEVGVLRSKSEETDLLKEPASDYLWLSEQYPVPSEAPNLEQQIDSFLSLPVPDEVPRQTLWVFTFGTWEIWNLAALPIDSSRKMVERMADKLIQQIEKLNFKSTDSGSVAFSDFWCNATDAEVKKLSAPNAADKVDVRRLECFRVLIPELFDISLAPGWQDRPTPPYPHTKGEHLRNAAVLTKHWNFQMREKLKDWELRGAARPNVTQDDDGTLHVARSKVSESEKEEQGRTKRDIVYAPYPRRMGHQSRFAMEIVESMTEEEMRRAELEDSKGHGTWPLNDTMRFTDVWEPCLSVSGDGRGQGDECGSPNDHLFYDRFTIGQRATNEIARRTASDVVGAMFRKLKTLDAAGRTA